MSKELQSDAVPTIVIYRSLWFTMCFSLFMLGVALRTTFPMNPESWLPAETEGVRDILTRTPGVFFSGAAILILLLSRIIPSLFKHNFVSQNSSGREETRRQGQAFFVFVMRFALLESIAILGFVLAFLEKSFQVYLIFALVALMNMLIRFPRAKSIPERAHLS